MTTMDFGFASLRTAPFDEITVFSSRFTPRSDLGSEPVARITARPASSVEAPSLPFTSPTLFDLSQPVPGKSVTVLLRHRPLTPLAIRPATLGPRLPAG